MIEVPTESGINQDGGDLPWEKLTAHRVVLVDHFPAHDHNMATQISLIVAHMGRIPDKSCAEVVGEGVDGGEVGVVDPRLQVEQLLQSGAKVLLPGSRQGLLWIPAGNLHKTFVRELLDLLVCGTAVGLQHWGRAVGGAVRRGKTGGRGAFGGNEKSKICV